VLRSYLVEAYVPVAEQHDVESVGGRLSNAAALLRSSGTLITFDAAILLPDDELALYLFTAEASVVVRRLLRAAQVRFDRIAASRRLAVSR
jgi:hypothetical protein